MQGYSSNTILTSDQHFTQLQIFISGRSLKDMDVFSKSDPYVRVSFKRTPTQPWVLLGRTQTADNNLNPNFQRTFLVHYCFEAHQHLKFDVMDEDDKSNSNNDDYIGSVQTTLGALAGARDQTSILSLFGANKTESSGKLILRVQPCVFNKNFLRMKWRAWKLLNTDSWFDWWDKSDPYIKLLKIRKDNTFVEAVRSEIVMNNLDPSWREFQIGVAKLIREDNQDQKFKIQCWDWEQAGEAKHQFIGQAYVTLPSILNAKIPMEVPLQNPKSKKPGMLVLQSLKYYEKPTFFDYLQGGLQLNLSVAIDFTGSNDVPTRPTSLHYMDKYAPNQYQKAMIAVGSILLNYDYDKMVPAFGFGAKTRFTHMNGNMVNHCFPLSGREDHLEAPGLDGLMAMYANALNKLQFSGPTLFAPLIERFVAIASQNMKEGSYAYQVLLIMTDGQIHDMEKTVDLIVRNSNLPLSIIIVGVGNADFNNMNILDGDNGLFDSKGRRAERDIVQFVPFNQVEGNSDLLAKQLLAELPDQVVQYMSMMKIPPGKAAEVNLSTMMVENSYKIENGLRDNLPKIFESLACLNVSDPNSK